MSSEPYTPAGTISSLVVALPVREESPETNASLDDWLRRNGCNENTPHRPTQRENVR